MDANSALQYSDPASAAMNGGMGLPAPVQQARARLQADVAAEKKEMAPEVQKIKDVEATPHPEQPDLQKSPAAPKAADYSKDGQAWVGALAAMSAIIGARGRARGTGALKAYAAGLKGVQEGNQQAFDNSLKEWQANTKAILDDNKTELDKFKTVMDDRSLTEQEASDAIKVIAAEHQDSIMIDAKDLEQQMKLYDIREQQAARLQEHTEKQQEKADAIKDATWTPEEQLQYAQQWNAGDKAGVTAAARAAGPAGGMNINGIKKMAADMNIKNGVTGEMQANIDSQYAAKRAGMSQEQRSIGLRAGPTLVGSAELESLIPATKESVKKLDLTKYPSVNALINSAEYQNGDPDIVEAATNIQEVQNAYASILKRGGQQTDAANAAAEHLVNIGMAEGQVDRILDTMSANAARIMKGVSNAKAGRVGDAPTPTDLDHLKKYPSSKASFDEHFGAGAADKALQGQ